MGSASRGTIDDALKADGLTRSVEAGKIMLESLEESLDSGDDLVNIAYKVTFLHDFPCEVGGGGFSGGMRSIPEIRRKLIYALDAESKKSKDLENNGAF
ncbi:MAG: hypothetical protein WCT36_00005, partial [Candidatus Gracilibacteria bacterium]